MYVVDSNNFITIVVDLQLDVESKFNCLIGSLLFFPYYYQAAKSNIINDNEKKLSSCTLNDMKNTNENISQTCNKNSKIIEDEKNEKNLFNEINETNNNQEINNNNNNNNNDLSIKKTTAASEFNNTFSETDNKINGKFSDSCFNYLSINSSPCKPDPPSYWTKINSVRFSLIVLLLNLFYLLICVYMNKFLVSCVRFFICKLINFDLVLALSVLICKYKCNNNSKLKATTALLVMISATSAVVFSKLHKGFLYYYYFK